jgi:beta-lactam-binding protein with PASTA domain
MKFLSFLFSKTFLKHLLIAVGISLVILISILLWIRIYTHHGQAITVPDMTGLSEEEVMIITGSKNLRFEITDSIFFKELPKGTVARQNPKPGSKVKENRRIYLTMNAVNPEMVTMPAVTGVTLRQARSSLESYGLVLGKITYKPHLAVNLVLEQRYKNQVIDPGKMVAKGSDIELVLGKGLSDETTELPDLIGYNLFMAREMLADRYLNPGAVIYDGTIKNETDTATAFIWKQRPEYKSGNQLKLGANVDLWLTVDSLKLPSPGLPENESMEELSYENF